MLLEIEKTVAEGAGAAGLAAAAQAPPAASPDAKSGWCCAAATSIPLVLSSIIERGMARSGRLARLAVELRDLPGELARVTACLAQAGANIDESPSSAHVQPICRCRPRGRDSCCRRAVTNTWRKSSGSCRHPGSGRRLQTHD